MRKGFSSLLTTFSRKTFLDEMLANDVSNRNVQEVASSVLIDSLASEWWSSNLSPTVINDLLENLIPLVVLACEKVLNEADERNLIGTTTSDRSFNPLNRLASYLMRHNPKYLHYSSISPYHYAMKSLLNTKRIQVLKVYGEEETQLKTILKDRQQQRFANADTDQVEKDRRRQELKNLFLQWNVPERGWIQTKLINNMIEQFNEMNKNRQFQVQVATFQSHRMHLGTFTDNFLQILSNQSSKDFDSIVELYRRCAQTYRTMMEQNQLDLLFQRLFQQLDTDKTGNLRRKNVFQTLKNFYEMLPDENKKYVFPSDQWPVVKQGALNLSKPTSESSASEEHPEEGLVTNEQENLLPTETEDEEPKKTIELKDPSAYDPNFRFVKEQAPIYNLEHFDSSDVEQPISFDEEFLNKIQFSSLLNSFVHLEKNEPIVCALIDYFRSNYDETIDDKHEKKTLLHQRQIVAQRRVHSDVLFDKINFTCTGLIKVEPLLVYLKQYKEGSMVEQVEQLTQKYGEQAKLSKEQFYDFLVDVHQTFNEVLGGNEKFDDLIKFIDNQQPQLSAADRTRAHTRHQWIKRIANLSSRNVEHLYKEVFEILQRDAETFAGGDSPKNLSIYLALIDDDQNEIRYVAATNDHADILLGKTLKRGQGISFQILDTGKWAYVNQTKNHNRLFFFNSSMKNQSGSFVLMPLKRLQSDLSFGLLGIDTIRDKKEKAFAQHEVQFYEGLASTLAKHFSSMIFDRILMKNFQRFLFSIEKRCPKVSEVDFYFYESIASNERILKHVLHFSNGQSTIFDTPKTINSREQIFKFYLDYAAITGQSTTNSFLNQTHFVHILRGNDQFCFALIDVNLGEKQISSDEEKDLIDSFRSLSMFVDELQNEIDRDEKQKFFDYEKKSERLRRENLFDRISFVDICYRLKHFDERQIQLNDQTKEIISIIGQLVKAKDVHPNEFVNVLLPALVDFDPTSNDHQWTRAEQYLQKINRSQSSEFHKLLIDWLRFASELSKLSK